MRTRRHLVAVVAAFVVAVAATVLAPLAASATGSVPVLATISPRTGLSAGGNVVTLTGHGFIGATEVAFGGKAAPSFTVVSDDDITATSPPHEPGIVSVVVVAPGGVSVSASTTTFTYAGPYIIKVTPNVLSVAGGSVLVTGFGFAGATAVDVGSTPAISFAHITNMVLAVVLPAQPVGTEDIAVTTPIGTSPVVSADRVRFVVPVVNLIMPTGGPANRSTTVELTGNGLIGATAVYFGTASAVSFAVHGPTAISALAPPQAPSTVVVTVVTPAGVTAVTARDYYTYRPPTITRIMPRTGPAAGGTTVFITGSLFSGLRAVTFGGVAAEHYTVEAAGILAVSPPGSAGSVDVQVTASAGTSVPVAADHFTYS